MAIASVLLGQLAPRDADDAVAGDEERAIAGAVGFEGRPCAVGGEAVELDDEVLVGPEAVDLFAVDLLR